MEPVHLIVLLNVGGTVFSTSSRTLSGDIGLSILKSCIRGDTPGVLFLDVDPRGFSYLLNYLRKPSSLHLSGVPTDDLPFLADHARSFGALDLAADCLRMLEHRRKALPLPALLTLLNTPQLSQPINLDGVSFYKTDLSGMRFHQVSLRHADFSHAQLANTAFEKCDLFGATFAAATLSQTRFEGCTLQDASFQGAHFTNATFSSSVLIHVTFEGCTSDASSTALTFSSVHLDRVALHAASTQFKQGIRFGMNRNAVLQHICLAGVTVVGADFSGSRMRNCEFTQCRFVDCEFGEAELVSCMLDGSQFVDCAFPSMIASQTSFAGCGFTHTPADRSVDFIHARCDECDFVGVKVYRWNVAFATFTKCDLRGLQCPRVYSSTDCRLVDCLTDSQTQFDVHNT
jgi:uncharacterized protein YjbI with pentapeptide repeats